MTKIPTTDTWEAWKLLGREERATPKVKVRQTDLRVLFAQ